MDSKNSSKLKLLCVLELLKKYSDEEHPVTAQTLCELLKTHYDIAAERKSVYSDIECLAASGVNIVKVSRKGFFLAERTFELAEIRLLQDAVLAAGFVTDRRSREICEKLCGELSVYQAQRVRLQTHFEGRPKSENEHFIYSVDTIQRAIAEGRRVEFSYYKRRINGGMVTRELVRTHVVSPYALIWDRDKYYLVGNYDKYGDLSHYRIDRMGSVRILDERSRPFEEVCGYSGSFDPADYARKAFGMYSGEQAQIELLCSLDLLERVADKFGSAAFYESEGECFRVKAEALLSEGLVEWLLTLGASCRVVEPEDLRRRLRERARAVLMAQSDKETLT